MLIIIIILPEQIHLEKAKQVECPVVEEFVIKYVVGANKMGWREK